MSFWRTLQCDVHAMLYAENNKSRWLPAKWIVVNYVSVNVCHPFPTEDDKWRGLRDFKEGECHKSCENSQSFDLITPLKIPAILASTILWVKLASLQNHWFWRCLQLLYCVSGSFWPVFSSSEAYASRSLFAIAVPFYAGPSLSWFCQFHDRVKDVEGFTVPPLQNRNCP